MEKAELCELKEKILTRNLQHDTKSTVKRESDKTAQVMQSNVNFHTAGKIVECRIVCNISYNYNSIKSSVKKEKKKEKRRLPFSTCLPCI